MNVDEFEKATPRQLRDKANELFEQAETAGGNDKAHLLLAAQFYLQEIDRRGQSRVGRRDFWLEALVILLIGVEIIIALYEGHGQSGQLDSLNENAAATAKMLEVTADAVKQLQDEQKRMVDAQNSTLTTTSKMNTVMQGQLDILRRDQKERLAELAKKPKLQVGVGGVVLSGSTSAVALPIHALEFTSTKAIYQVIVKNVSDASTKLFFLKILTNNANVSLSADTSYSNLNLPSEMTDKGISIQADNLPAGQWAVIKITASYPDTVKDFLITFNASGEAVGNQTFGTIEVRPPLQSK